MAGSGEMYDENVADSAHGAGAIFDTANGFSGDRNCFCGHPKDCGGRIHGSIVIQSGTLIFDNISIS